MAALWCCRALGWRSPGPWSQRYCETGGLLSCHSAEGSGAAVGLLWGLRPFRPLWAAGSWAAAEAEESQVAPCLGVLDSLKQPGFSTKQLHPSTGALMGLLGCRVE